MKYTSRKKFEDYFLLLFKYANYVSKKKKLNISSKFDIEEQFIKELFNLSETFNIINNTGNSYITDIIYDCFEIIDGYIVNNYPMKQSTKHEYYIKYNDFIYVHRMKSFEIVENSINDKTIMVIDFYNVLEYYKKKNIERNKFLLNSCVEELINEGITVDEIKNEINLPKKTESYNQKIKTP